MADETTELETPAQKRARIASQQTARRAPAPSEDDEDDEDEDTDEEDDRKPVVNYTPNMGTRKAVRITSVPIEGEKPRTVRRPDYAPNGGVFRSATGDLKNAHGLRVNRRGKRVKADGSVFTPAEELAELRAMVGEGGAGTGIY